MHSDPSGPPGRPFSRSLAHTAFALRATVSFLVLLAGWSCAPVPPSSSRPARPLVGAEQRRTVAARADAAIASAGETRVLLVFVQFRDDEEPGSPCLDYRGWPLSDDPTRLPAFATTLLSPSPDPPFADSSLTEYFYQQSNGRLVLFGDVYPRVYRTRHPAAYYHRGQGRGYGHLTAELLEAIDPEVDFSRYDTNPADGQLDQLFVVIRDDPEATFTGVASLYGADRVSGRPPGPPPTVDGVRVDWIRSGSIFIHRRPGHIIAQHYYVRLMAHEYGHHLWNSRGFFGGGHIRAITSNQVPGNGTERLGYVLMAGRGGGRDCRGDELISAFERDLLGWLDPTVLDPRLTPDTTVVLRDAYLSGDVLKIPLSDPRPDTEVPVVYIENRQPLGPFDRPRVWKRPGCRTYRLPQLMTSGLLVSLADPSPGGYRLDVLPADNTLELSVDASVYQGDLFGPPGAVQLTPWTTPPLRRPDGQPSWVALDDMRVVQPERGVYQLRFVPDVRKAPVIRSASTMGPETDGVAFESPLRMAEGQTLHVRDATVLAPGLDLQPGARLAVDPGASLVLGEAGLTARGNVEIDVRGMLSLTRTPVDASGLQLRLHPSGLLVMGADTLRTSVTRVLTGVGMQ